MSQGRQYFFSILLTYFKYIKEKIRKVHTRNKYVSTFPFVLQILSEVKKSSVFPFNGEFFFSFTPNLCVMKYFNMYCVLFKDKHQVDETLKNVSFQLSGQTRLFWAVY